MSMIGEGVRVDAQIEEGNVRMSVSDGGELYFKPEERPPLSLNETHVTLSVATEDASVSIDLDGRQIDALADAVNHYQEELRERK